MTEQVFKRKFRKERVTFDPHADVFAEEFGLSREAILAIVMRPQRTIVDPKSKEVGYPILIHYSGDVRVTVGYRNPDSPRVLHCTVESGYSRPAGSQRPSNSGSSLPKSQRQLRAWILNLGYSISQDNHPKVIDPENETVIFTLPGTPSDHRSIGNNWKAFQKAHVKYQVSKTKDETLTRT